MFNGISNRDRKFFRIVLILKKNEFVTIINKN